MKKIQEIRSPSRRTHPRALPAQALRSSLRYAQRPAPGLALQSPLVRNPTSNGGLIPPPSFPTFLSNPLLSIAYLKLLLV